MSPLSLAMLSVSSRSTPASFRLTGGAWNKKWSGSNVMCMKRAVFTGTFPYVVRATFVGYVPGFFAGSTLSASSWSCRVSFVVVL